MEGLPNVKQNHMMFPGSRLLRLVVGRRHLPGVSAKLKVRKWYLVKSPGKRCPVSSFL
jgi:hypothetical protein